ncbi:flagellar basal body-associated FliL family protein [Simkania negevensis]|uniref:Flagellar protein FliL n=1 Tax=Simkania negevensis TaxID=83561 RepID=A0ABS3AQB7_9BACT|nr:flagellar basal body-associated FliL family protein [Simkania negevensis]
MAPEEEKPSVEGEPKKKNILPWIILIVVLIVLVVVVILFFFTADRGEEGEPEKVFVEYPVRHKLYQLKDGSYLKLGFNIVVEEDDVDTIKEVLEIESPGRLTHGIHSILGNKTSEELMGGSHKREAFARELEKMIEDQVLRNYNLKQDSAKNQIKVHEILLTDFITQ